MARSKRGSSVAFGCEAPLGYAECPQIVPEESGGPFVETAGSTEFGYDVEASNPKGTKPEPFPTT